MSPARSTVEPGTGRGVGRARERAVLALGLVSALLLAGTAFAPFSDPDVAGRAALSQFAGRVADGIVAECERILRDPLRTVGPATAEFEWKEGESAPLPSAVPRDVAPAASAAIRAYDALMNEAARVEGEDPASAISIVLEVLQKDLAVGQRAEARLRAIQLAARASRPDVAREQVDRALAELGTTESRGDVAYVLLCGLAAAPMLEPSRRAAVGLELVDAWTSGRLALPGRVRIEGAGEAHPFACDEDPLREALRVRLAEMCEDPGATSALSAERERRRVEALAQIVHPLPQRPADTDWHFAAAQGALLGWRAAAPDRVTACFFRWSDLGDALRASVAAHDLLPDGFRLDLAGDDASLGALVRDRTPLFGGDLGFALRHADPESAVRTEARRLGFVRAALLLMAAFAAAAGIATYRALRRERHLAGLRSSFVASVSHELRTPVASILLMAENLESGRASGEARARYPASIRREATRLRRLVDDVLDFSRIERGKRLELRVAEVDLESWIEDLRVELADWAARSGAELSIAIGEVHGCASLDVEALRRAVFNLLDNALKHAGTRTARFSARVEERALVLAVADPGRGIPQRQREKVFEPFARLHDGNGAAPGTGLGLAIVREIAAAHGGTVSIRDPEEGAGVEFVLRIPLEPTEIPRA